jgi:hypothetical protein
LGLQVPSYAGSPRAVEGYLGILDVEDGYDFLVVEVDRLHCLHHNREAATSVSVVVYFRVGSVPEDLHVHDM